MAFDAVQLGLQGTMRVLRQLLADRFGFPTSPDDLPEDDSLFAIGLGLSSLDGIEFLCEVERQFGVRMKDLDWWVYESPTLANVAAHVIDLSRQQQLSR